MPRVLSTTVLKKKKEKPAVSKINSWKPTKEVEKSLLVDSDGKIFIIYFEKIIEPRNIVCNFDRFLIKKGSYEKKLGLIAKYINYFMKFYDAENELALAYFKIKYAIDKEKMFDKDNPNQLIELIYEVMFTPSVIEKVNRLVEDNYLEDIEKSDGKYDKKDKKHLESLEFTNQHIKILLRISFGMKMIAPILFHYVSTNVIKIEKDSELIFNFYKGLFDIFSDGVNMYNKLFVYVKAKVLESKSHNSPIFEQRNILGNDEYSVIRLFLHKVLISENLVKYKFNENIIGLNC